MFSKKRVIADADYFSSKWAPVVLRFFQLFTGDQSAAESLTIDTLAEYIRARGVISDEEAVVPLLRRAFMKARATNAAATQLADPVVRAVTQLEPTKRAVVVLFRALSLDMATVGKITGLGEIQVRRTCIDALEEFRRLLDSSAAVKAVRPALGRFDELA